LIVRVRGGTRRDALRWLADYVRTPLTEGSLSRRAANVGQNTGANKRGSYRRRATGVAPPLHLARNC